jgi:hypothetical protein
VTRVRPINSENGGFPARGDHIEPLQTVIRAGERRVHGSTARLDRRTS